MYGSNGLLEDEMNKILTQWGKKCIYGILKANSESKFMS